MDGTLIVAIIAAVLTALVALAWRATSQRYRRTRDEDAADAAKYAKAASITLVVVTLGFFALSCFTRVGTNQIGIMNSFGRPVDALPNGIHLKAPWETKVEFDASRQFLRFEGQGNNKEGHGEKTFPCFAVRIVNNAGACVKGVVTWQMRAKTAEEKRQAVELYRQYRTFERLNDNFVAQSTQAALLATFSDVNPLVPEKNPAFAALSDVAEGQLHRIVGAQVEVLDFQITFVDWDDKTDAAIQAVQAQIAKTAEEKQRQLTNEAAAKAAAALGSSTSGPPPSEAVLINKCLDIAAAQGKEPGWCFLRGGTPILQRPA